MLDAGSDGCSRSLVPSVGGWLTDLSAAGAVIPTAVTVPRFFFFYPGGMISNHNSNRKILSHISQRSYSERLGQL